MYRCVSVRFFHFATCHISETRALTHEGAHPHTSHACGHTRERTHGMETRTSNLFIYFIPLQHAPPRISNINTGKLATTTHTTIGESHELVFYTEEEVFFRDLCAVQLLGNPASTDAVVVIRRLCAKARLKEQTRLCRRCGVSGTTANSDWWSWPPRHLCYIKCMRERNVVWLGVSHCTLTASSSSLSWPQALSRITRQPVSSFFLSCFFSPFNVFFSTLKAFVAASASTLLSSILRKFHFVPPPQVMSQHWAKRVRKWQRRKTVIPFNFLF